MEGSKGTVTCEFFGQLSIFCSLWTEHTEDCSKGTVTCDFFDN